MATEKPYRVLAWICFLCAVPPFAIGSFALYDSWWRQGLTSPELPKSVPSEIVAQLDLTTDMESLNVVVPGKEIDIPMGSVVSVHGLYSVSNIIVTVDGVSGVGTGHEERWGDVLEDFQERDEWGSTVKCHTNTAQFPSLALKCGTMVEATVSGTVSYPKKYTEKKFANETKFLSNTVRLFVASQSDYDAIRAYANVKSSPRAHELNTFMLNCSSFFGIGALLLGYLFLRVDK